MELSKYIEYKLRLFKDFCVEPTGEDILKIRRCTTVMQVDNVCRRILSAALGED